MITQVLTRLSDRVYELPNSTYFVETQSGPLLVNCPPETLKYLLDQGLPPPQTIILPPDMPSGVELGSSGFVYQGINYASVEFLLYANFFGKNRRVHVVSPSANQVHRLTNILEETFNGPSDPAEYGSDLWLQRECRAAGYSPALGRAPAVSDLVDITSLEIEGGRINEHIFVSLEKGAYFIFEDGQVIAEIPTRIKKRPRPLTLSPAQPLQRRELTLQFIGGSDGFDPSGITTCFLAYLGSDVTKYQATLFDAAAFLRVRLGSLGLSTRHISEVVISHLHEDHIAGLPELLLMGEQRMRLLTSDIIYGSLLRVLGEMLNIPTREVAALFDYIPLNPGQPQELEGRRFESSYAIHTVPTIAVRANGLYYSGDMRYDESWFEELVADGVLTPARRDSLINFAAGAEVVDQDAGGGSVHTTVTPELLKSLAEKGKRIILAHTSEEALPLEAADWAEQVEFASSGHISAHGDSLEDERQDIELTYRLETIEASPLLSRLTQADREFLATHAELTEWQHREKMIRQGEESDDLSYIVHTGLVDMVEGDESLLMVGRGSLIGVRETLRFAPRMRTFQARGDRVQLLRLRKELFWSIAAQLKLFDAYARAEWLSKQPLFRELLWSTTLDLALEFQPRGLRARAPLFNHGDLGKECYLLVSGGVEVLSKHGEMVDTMKRPGSFFGARSALYNTPRNASARTTTFSEIWTLPSDSLKRLQTIYPNILMHLRAIEFHRRGGEVD